MASPLSDMGRGQAAMEPGRHRHVTQVVRGAGKRRTGDLGGEHGPPDALPGPDDSKPGQLLIVAFADEQPAVGPKPHRSRCSYIGAVSSGGHGTVRTVPRSRCLS
ncbi:hypothetical protein Psuf_020060 [Phytohabitans suffuscus]|uniref:Uncharacterized protein n=1 Tax=Phytohabitans suffuscus TaxID=624315 RepID=A0A6F8YF84_9ACTN|nr:hypothetical protein Psuf_020060 [Phytohabitans suffuscus]